MMIMMAETIPAALARLDAERKSGGPAPKATGKVALKDLHAEPAAFQIRDDAAPIKEHVEGIAQGIGRSAQDAPLEVWWSGCRWIVIDGHHRHAAYLSKLEQGKLKDTFKVPVRVQQADSAATARLIASRMNSRVTLTTTNDERLEEAWRLRCLGTLKRPGIREATGVSRAALGVMGGVVDRLTEKGWTVERLIAAGRKEATRIDAEKERHGEWTAEAEDEAVKEIIERMKRGGILLDKLAANPDRVAAVIACISPRLPEQLVEIWSYVEGEEDIPPAF